jgi:hypothetical protein
MYNESRYHEGGYNRIREAGEGHVATIGQNTLTLMFDTEIIPLTYIGEQFSYSNSPWMPQSGYYPNCWLAARDTYVYFAGNDGYVHRYGVGTDDNGEKISAHYVVPGITLGHPDLMKRLRWIDIDAESLPDSFLRISYKMDNHEEWTLLCELEQGNLTYPFIEFPRELFRKISLKFENAHTGCEFALNGVTLDLVVRGQMREMVTNES